MMRAVRSALNVSGPPRSPAEVQELTIALIMLIVHLEWDPAVGPDHDVLQDMLLCDALPKWFSPWPLLEPMDDRVVVDFLDKYGVQLRGNMPSDGFVRETIVRKFGHAIDTSCWQADGGDDDDDGGGE